MFKAVALDLDGTTLREDGTISALTALTLNAVAKAGVHVVPATARPPRSTFEKIEAATFAVCCNGALVVDSNDETILERTLDRVSMAAVVTGAISVVPDLGFGIRCHDLLVGNASYFELRDQPPPVGSVWLETPGELLAFDAHALSFRARNVTSAELADALRPGVPQDFGQISISSGDVLDIAPDGVTKATGLAQLGRKLGFGGADVIAYGDMPNDAAMLAWADLGVVVRGAHPDAAAAADLTIGCADDDAVATHLGTVFALDI